MPLLTPALISLAWSQAPGVDMYDSRFDVQVGPGGLIRAGIPLTSSKLGCTLITYNTTTGEPLTYTAHAMVATGSGLKFRGVYHFPAENAVVLFGEASPSTATLHRVYGQRIVYNIATGTLTAGPLATWSPNPTTSSTKDSYAADVPNSTTINVFGHGVFNYSMSTLNLTAGTASAKVDYTVDSLCGGGRNRSSWSGAGRNFPGVLLAAAYVSTAGIGSAETFRIPFTSTPGTAVNTGLGVASSIATDVVPYGTTSTYMPNMTFPSGASPRLLSSTGFAAAPSSLVRTDPAVTTHTSVGTNNASPNLLSVNDETSANWIARLYDPATGAEQQAWQFNSSVYNEVAGMLSADRRFFWDWTGTAFRVWQDLAWVPVTDTWHVGAIGASW